MTRFPKIWFLRHGQTEWNAEHRIQGQLESDLTDIGRAQAQSQAALIAPILEAHQPPCLVSPLRRAQDTAKIALQGYPFVTEPKLMEVQAGTFQGRTLDEITQSHPDIRASAPHALDLFCAAPDGEGFDAFYERVHEVLSGLECPTVIVAHGLLGQVLRGIICDLDRSAMAKLPNEQGCIYVLENGQETLLQAG